MDRTACYSWQIIRRKYWFGALAWLLLAATSGKSQPPAPDSLQPVADTVAVQLYFPDDPADLRPVGDSTLSAVHQFDPLRQQAAEWLNLGNLGTAHKRLYYQPEYRRGLVSGRSQFDLYRIHPDSLPFYVLGKAYTDVLFSQGGSQEDGYFRGVFSRNFSSRINLSVAYRRLNQTGTRSNFKYANQRAQNTALAVGFRYLSLSGRYEAFASYHFDIIRQENNGGVTDSDLLETPGFPGAFAASVRLGESLTRHDHRTARLVQYWHLTPPDSTGMDVSIRHKIGYHTDRFKNTDDLNNAPSSRDSAFYGLYLVDGRGLRNFVQITTLANELTMLLDREGQKLEVGLWHSLYGIREEDDRYAPHNLYLTGRLRARWMDNLHLDAKGQLGLVDQQAGDYRIDGTLAVGNHLEVRLVNQLYSPSLTEQRLVVSGREIWNTSFDKTFTNSLAGKVRVPGLNLVIQGAYHVMSGLVFFDQQGLPRQESGTVSLLQGMLQHQLGWKTIRLHNTLVWQGVSGSDVLRVPDIFSEHQFSVDLILFQKRMRLRLGADMRIFGSYFPDAYQPMSGQFHLQDEREAALAAAIDGYASFMVSGFRFFFSIGNIVNPLNDRVVFPSYAYPLLEGNTRFGIRWVLRD